MSALRSAATGAASRWVPVVVWAGVISLLSSEAFSGDHTGGLLLPVLQMLLPGASADALLALHALARKLAHVVEYAILAVLAVRALDHSGRPTIQVAATSLALCVAWAVLDETRQTFVPNRVGSPVDVAIDAAGAFLGVAARLGARVLSAGRRSPA
jgi:VanZ family protein